MESIDVIWIIIGQSEYMPLLLDYTLSIGCGRTRDIPEKVRKKE
jgi:hypothetical protein